jgi:pimeloyl-ACP methyl ester carboxylesterase
MNAVLTDDGVELAVTVTGHDLDAQVAVVLLHGWCLSSEIYRHQVAGLAGQPVRLISYDMRGHGRSGPAPQGTTSIARVAEDLRAVIEATCADLPVVLVGHSLGGMTIMALAELEPALFDTRVAGVVFVNTAAGGLHRVTFGFPKRLAELVRARLSREFARRHRAHLRRGDGEVRRRFTDALLARAILFGPGANRDDVRLGRRLIRTAHPGVVEGFFADLMRHDRHRALRHLAQVPVRILAGDRDRLTPPSHSRRIRATLPHSRLVVFPGAGHMIPLERAEELTTEIIALTRRVIRRTATPPANSATGR